MTSSKRVIGKKQKLALRHSFCVSCGARLARLAHKKGEECEECYCGDLMSLIGKSYTAQISNRWDIK